MSTFQCLLNLTFLHVSHSWTFFSIGNVYLLWIPHADLFWFSSTFFVSSGGYFPSANSQPDALFSLHVLPREPHLLLCAKDSHSSRLVSKTWSWQKEKDKRYQVLWQCVWNAMLKCVIIACAHRTHSAWRICLNQFWKDKKELFRKMKRGRKFQGKKTQTEHRPKTAWDRRISDESERRPEKATETRLERQAGEGHKRPDMTGRSVWTSSWEQDQGRVSFLFYKYSFVKTGLEEMPGEDGDQWGGCCPTQARHSKTLRVWQ